jgi:multicomponent Na+:H+ antiporter subunit G
MPPWIDPLVYLLLAIALFFFTAGTVGLLRFPDLFSRLHALTKCDNLGLGLVVLAVALRAGDPWLAVKLALIWLLALASSATACYLVARLELENEAPPEEPGS